jgi:uracil-DNA glycosylase
MDVKIESSWKRRLEDQFEQPYFGTLADFVKKEYQVAAVYPPAKLIFRAFDLTPFEAVKVVILGQDPYINAGEAMGLSFSVPDGTRIPPSLQNIYKEIESEFGQKMIHTGGDLTRWAEQGVLLLNASLTVRARLSNSHQGKGWEEFTSAAIAALSNEREHLVFMLWGNYARQKGAHIDRNKHLVLESPHPSPFSANNGFFGNGHFKKANEYLEAHGERPIDWL